MSDRMFYLPENRGYILFESSVLTHMYDHAQHFWLQREAGGQLFSPTPQDTAVIITHATGPYPSDVRRRHGFVPDVKHATADRQSHFSEQRYAVGLWHTHPEANPSPSGRDRDTAKEYLNAFEGEMTGFLLVILGNRGNPPNLAVWLAQESCETSWIKLSEA